MENKATHLMVAGKLEGEGAGNHQYPPKQASSDPFPPPRPHFLLFPACPNNITSQELQAFNTSAFGYTEGPN